MRKIIIVMFVAGNGIGIVFAQTPSSSVWLLTANQSASVTGDVTATDQTLSNMQVSYSSSVQRSSPSGTAGAWIAESAENSTRYMQFAVSPQINFEFTVSSISLKLYVNSGSGMFANVYYSTDSTFAVKTKIGATLNLSSSAPASPNVVISPTVVVAAGKTMYVRMYPWYNTATTGKYIIANAVSISGTTLNNIAPIVTPSVVSLPEFGTSISGSFINGSPYSISALNLVSNLIVSAPKGFAVSKDSSVFSDSIMFVPVNGTIANAFVYTRFAPTSASGFIEDVIVHKSLGALPKNVSVIGVALAAEPTIQSSMAIGMITGNSIALNFSGGNGNRRIVVARKDSAVNFLPVDGNEISGADSNFSAALEQGNGNKVVYDGNGSMVTIVGVSVATQYHFAVFEYNIGTGNSHNYRAGNPGIGNATTLAVPGINAAPAIISFGNVVTNTSSKEKVFQVSGLFLIPASGNLTITTSKGFYVSQTSGAGFDSAVTVAYSAATVVSKSIYIQFKPTSKENYSGNIVIAGGGASQISVAVSGTGVDQIFVPDSIPFGFASLSGGTTGGVGGTSIIITSGQQLADIMLPREKTSDLGAPLVLYISGTISGYANEVSIKRTKNISIIGIGADAKVQGFGFKIVESSNIVIRNVSFADCKVGEKDAISVEGSNNIWIDHCSFTDSPSIDLSGGSHDGLLDVKKGSYNVTLSYNHFQNHRKTCLLGHSPSETGDVALRVTYYRNWFDGTYSRHPRARYGKAHIINNLYTSAGVVGVDGGGYGVGSTCGASLLVEANYFEGTTRPTLISQVNDPGETLSGDPIGYLKALNNYAVSSGPIVENLTGYNFDPSESYTYTSLDGQLVKDVVMATAGAGKLDGGAPTSVIRSMTNLPTNFNLFQNYPNPFNPTTIIQFTVAREQSVTLTIYNAIGQKVATVFSGIAERGKLYSVQFNGRSFSSGMYFSVLENGSQRLVKKILLTK